MSSSTSGTNSILLLACRTLWQIRFDPINFFLPFVFGTLAAILFFRTGTIFESDKLSGLLGNLLQFNGALLGLLMAGFGVYSAVPANRHTVFSIVNAPENGKFSFFKLRLITIFKIAFWSFLCTGGFLFLYFVATFELFDVLPASDHISQQMKQSCTIGIAGLLQTKIFVELKIYVHTVYTRTITEARLVAMSEGQQPFDKSID